MNNRGAGTVDSHSRHWLPIIASRWVVPIRSSSRDDILLDLISIRADGFVKRKLVDQNPMASIEWTLEKLRNTEAIVVTT